MKYLIAIALAFLVLAPVATALAYIREPGEWSDWWAIDRGGYVRRIYDKENKLVCWIYQGSNSVGGISCAPSLELDNPMAQ